MNATCAQNKFRKCKATTAEVVLEDFCLDLGSKEVPSYCASEEPKWITCNMSHTGSLSSSGAVCRGLQGCAKPGKAGTKELALGQGKLVWPPWGCDTEKAEPIAQPPKFKVVRLLSGLIPTILFISGSGCAWLSVLTGAYFWLVEGFPSVTSCSREKCVFSFCVLFKPHKPNKKPDIFLRGMIKRIIIHFYYADVIPR